MLTLSLTSLLLLLTHLGASTASHIPVEFGHHEAYLRQATHARRAALKKGHDSSAVSQLPSSSSSVIPVSSSTLSSVAPNPSKAQAQSSSGSSTNAPAASSAEDQKFCHDQTGIQTKCVVIAGVVFIVAAGVYFTVKAWKSLKADQADAAQILDSEDAMTPDNWSKLNARVRKIILQNADEAFGNTVETWEANGYVSLPGQAGVDLIKNYLNNPTDAQWSRGDMPARLAVQWKALGATAQNTITNDPKYSGMTTTFDRWNQFSLAEDAARSGIPLSAVTEAPPAQGAQQAQPVEQAPVVNQPVQQGGAQEQPANEGPSEQLTQQRTTVLGDFITNLRNIWGDGSSMPKNYNGVVDDVYTSLRKAIFSNNQGSDLDFYNKVLTDIQGQIKSGAFMDAYVEEHGDIAEPEVEDSVADSSLDIADLDWRAYQMEIWGYEADNGVASSQQQLAEDASMVLNKMSATLSLDSSEVRGLQSRLAESIESGDLKSFLQSLGSVEEAIPGSKAAQGGQQQEGGENAPQQQQPKNGAEIIDGTISSNVRGKTSEAVEGQEEEAPTGQVVEVQPQGGGNEPASEGGEEEAEGV